ncbi:hypothetical protein JW707_02820 [Candidatus Woesearchaeota archaeon]|nr:hypothetical protein [Candidatus Woesearchaeota archaeon]
MTERNSNESLEKRLQQLEEEISSLPEDEKRRVRYVSEKFGWEWNKDKEEGYVETPQDKIFFREYGLDFIRKGRDILVVGDRGLADTIRELLKDYKHVVKFFGTRPAANLALSVSRCGTIICNYGFDESGRKEDSFLSRVKKNNESISTMVVAGPEERIAGSMKGVDEILQGPLSESAKQAVEQINLRLIMHDVFQKKQEIQNRKTNIYKPQPTIPSNEYADLLKSTPKDLEEALSPSFDFGEEQPQPVAHAEAVYPGAASGKIYSNFRRAARAVAKGEKVIMYVSDLNNLNIGEIKMLRQAEGIIFEKYSSLSHHVIDFMSAGVPIIKMSSTSQDPKEFVFGEFALKEGKPISFDGLTGDIYACEYATKPAQFPPEHEKADSGRKPITDFEKTTHQCDEVLERRIRIMLNASDIKAMEDGRRFGVYEIGLVRTEDILKQKQANIEAYGAYLLTLLSIKSGKRCGRARSKMKRKFRRTQSSAFYDLMKYQEGKRIQIRLLDPPLNEFFDEAVIDEIASKLPSVEKEVAQKFKELVNNPQAQRELRGVGIARDYPEIYEAQIDALFSAWAKLQKEKKEGDKDIDLKIFIPYVHNPSEVEDIKTMAERLNNEKYGGMIRYDLGVTLETFGGTLTAHKMIEMGIRHFTFGTNDLFPMIDNADRNTQGEAYVERDGKLVIKNPAILEALKGCLQRMASAGVSREEYEVGISGEMNPVKLDSLAEIIPALDYVSASRPAQVPGLKLKLAQIYLSKYAGKPV